MTPNSLIVPIMKANYPEVLILNIDYYVQYICYPFKPKYPKILIVNSKQIFGQLFLNTNNGKTINPNIQLFV